MGEMCIRDRCCFFFFKQKTAYEIGVRLVGSEMCIRDRLRNDTSEYGDNALLYHLGCGC